RANEVLQRASSSFYPCPTRRGGPMISADATPLAALPAPPTVATVPEPRLHGVSLAEYAAVLAGLAEGHQLGRVLAHEGINPAHWPDAEEAWSDRLADAMGTDDD